MHNIEAIIREYCAKTIPDEPSWKSILEHKFPKFAGSMDASLSIRQEFEDHLHSSFQSYLEKGKCSEDAWRLAKEHFGDMDFLAREIKKARNRSYKCLSLRLSAIIAFMLLPLGAAERIRFATFIHPQVLFLMAGCMIAGYWITRNRDFVSLRQYALYGTWLGLFYGLFEAMTMVANDPLRMGRPISFMLMSMLYGLFIADPGARKFAATAMLLTCQIGMATALIRSGIVPLVSRGVDAGIMKMLAEACIAALLAGFLVFDIRKLHRRIAGIAALGMFYAWIGQLTELRGLQSVEALIATTSLPALIAILMISPIQKLRQYMLREAS
jgi:hypothetical protein